MKIRFPVRLAAVMATVALGAACASAPPARRTGPAYPDLVSPDVPASLQASADIRDRHLSAWQLLQAGDRRGASRAYTEILKRLPAFYPAEAGLGTVALAGEDFRNAVPRFNAALAHDSRYVPALTGLVTAHIALDQIAEASNALERLLKVDPSREADRTRLDLLRIRQVQQHVDTARRARQSGRLEAAEAALSRALELAPQSAVIVREMALVELAGKRLDDAETRARRAVQLDPRDAENHATLGAVLEAKGRLREAATVYDRAADIDSTWRPKAEAARSAADRDGVPDELRSIGLSRTVSRGELAGLIGLRLTRILERAPKRAPAIATDVRSHWAAPWIATVTRAGVMEVLPNHTFQPGGVVQRDDLALISARVVGLALAGKPDLVRMQASRPALADVPAGNAFYRSIALSLAAGVMSIEEGGRFVPNRPASGAEVLQAIARLEQLEASPR